MKDRAIYTSIVGDIDSLMQPIEVDEHYDYICFVRKGCAAGDSGIWQLREIPCDIEDDRMLSRYPKMHPEELLSGYSWTLWIDGNISIKSPGFYRILDDIIVSGAVMAAPQHPQRDCIYDEALAVVAAGKGNYRDSHRVIKFLSENGFPRHYGLFENSLLLRSGGSPEVKALDKMWWHCLGSISGRDQLSLMYCARECCVNITPLLPPWVKIRDCDLLEYVYHDRKPVQPYLVKRANDALRRLAKWKLRREIAALG